MISALLCIAGILFIVGVGVMLFEECVDEQLAKSKENLNIFIGSNK